jgi:beta-glucosidase
VLNIRLKNWLITSFISCYLAVNSLAVNLPYQNSQLPVEQRVADLLGRMTLEEKVGQMNIVFSTDILNKPKTNLVPATIEKYFGQMKIGSIKNLGNACYAYTLKPGEIARIANEIQKYAIENTRLGIPVLVVEESLHGYTALDATVFPQAIGMASSWDPELIKEIGSVIATEIKATGGHQTYSPVLGVGREPRWGRVEETYGEDPYLVAKLGVAMVRGLQGKDFTAKDSVIATVKHFAVYSGTQDGLNMGPADISERTLREIFLAPFKAAIVDAKAESLMAGYNDLNGVPCHCNKFLLTDILKKKWGFKGYVVSDNMGIYWIADLHHVTADHKEAIEFAINSGLDMNLFPRQGFQESVIELVREGKISKARIDDAAGRILRIKFLLGLFDGKNVHSDPNIAARVCDSREHRQLALKAAHESIVLLKNEKNLLPLDVNRVKTIAVIGPNADAARTGDYSGKTHVVTVLEGIKNKVHKGTKVLFTTGCSLTGTSTEGFDEAVEMAKQADVVVLVLGGASIEPGDNMDKALKEHRITCGEGVDRADLNLPGVQDELAKAVYKTGKSVVVVLLNGRPLSIDWIGDNIPAIVEGWYPGEEGGTAIADIIFGDCNPSGKLAISFPKSVGQLPVYYNQRQKAHYPGGYLSMDAKPLYSFGYGLSYSTFEYSDLQVFPAKSRPAARFEVSVNVHNSSAREGDEVVQLYISDEVSSVTTPVKELKGFKRITLKAGESKNVKFVLGPEQLYLLDKNMHEVVEPGKFKVMVNNLNAEFEVTN